MEERNERPWVTTLAEGLQPATSGSPLEESYRRRHAGLRDAGYFRRLVQEGGMGAVLEVWAGDERNPWRLALKLLKPRWLDQPSAVERFRRELASHRRLSETLQATRLVPCLAFYDHEDPANIFGLFPYYSEGSLQQKLRDGIAMEEALFVLADAVEGLQSLHGHRYLHRDFHPHNVLLEREGGRLRGVLGDLGVGMFLEPNTIFSAEQLRHDRDHRAGHPGFIDPWSVASRQADLYSVGVTLYRVLTGHLPPEAGAREGLRLPEEVAHALDPGVREWGDEVLLRLSSADGKERYGCAREVRQDLVALAERVLEARPVAGEVLAGPVRSPAFLGPEKALDARAPAPSAPRTLTPAAPPTAEGTRNVSRRSAPPRSLSRVLSGGSRAPGITGSAPTPIPTPISTSISTPPASRTLPAPGRRRLALVGIALGLVSGLPVAWWLAPHVDDARLEAKEFLSASVQVASNDGELAEGPAAVATPELGNRGESAAPKAPEPALATKIPAASESTEPSPETEPPRARSEVRPTPAAPPARALVPPPAEPADPAEVEVAWKQRDLRALKRLARAHPGDPLVASRLALLLSRQGPGGLTAASRHLQEALIRHPERGDLRLMLGRTLLQQGHPAAARRLLRSAPEVSSFRDEIRTLLVTLDVDSDLQPRTQEETRR